MQNPSAPSGFGVAPAKSSTGLDANVAALLAYLLGLIGGIVFYVLEKDSKFVKFHSMQSILFNALVVVVFIGLTIVNLVLQLVASGISNGLGIIVGLLSTLVWLGICVAIFVAFVLCLVKAFQGKMFKLPVIGNMAEKFASK
jgi:uncharacterized membrane protein